MSISCKFKVQSVAYDQYKNETIDARAIWDNSNDNKSWADATPFGELKLVISNQDAQGAFEPGEDILLTISKFIPQI